MALVDLTAAFSVTDAKNRGQDIVDVIIGMWGRDGTDMYPFPGQPGLTTTLAGIKIGPQSELDRCWVTWNPGKEIADDNGPYIHRLSVDSPLLFSQVAGNGAITPLGEGFNAQTAMGSQKLYIFPNAVPRDGGGGTDSMESTILPEKFAPYFSPVPLDSDPYPIGTTFLGKLVNGNYNAVFPPLLHLQLILNSTALQLPTKRFPKTYRGNIVVSSDNNELMTIIPTHGRKTINVSVALDNSCTWRVGALRSVNWQRGLSNQDLYPIESLEGEKVATNPYTTKFQFCDLNADYITIWCETAVIGAICEYSVTVSD